MTTTGQTSMEAEMIPDNLYEAIGPFLNSLNIISYMLRVLRQLKCAVNIYVAFEVDAKNKREEEKKS